VAGATGTSWSKSEYFDSLLSRRSGGPPTYFFSRPLASSIVSRAPPGKDPSNDCSAPARQVTRMREAATPPGRAKVRMVSLVEK
jgi:hypothetical protein